MNLFQDYKEISSFPMMTFFCICIFLEMDYVPFSMCSVSIRGDGEEWLPFGPFGVVAAPSPTTEVTSSPRKFRSPGVEEVNVMELTVPMADIRKDTFPFLVRVWF